MYCSNCGRKRDEKARYCTHCGKRKDRYNVIFLSLIMSIVISGTVFATMHFIGNESTAEPLLAATHEEYRLENNNRERLGLLPVAQRQVLQEIQKRELTEIIADAQESVYTIFAPYSQGSGFLYNDQGAVVTNAHVVEGEIDVNVRTVDGYEYDGKVIGYSNETDVAVVSVPDLIGQTPFALEKEGSLMIGEEVIALGSPLGFENTATMGYVTGTNRNFNINSYVYENLYQISAPISPGSSGGPLLSKKSEKIIGINSAQNMDDTSIGFSIPLYQVNDLIETWIAHPMTETEILAQFYGPDGEYFFDDLWEYHEGYFDGGDLSVDEDFYDYWEYYYHEFWEDFGEEYWDYYLDESYYFDGLYDEWYEQWYEYWSDIEKDLEDWSADHESN
ncbi:trypsin-like peptidase domain-containing protein [Evansella cellulosilytica]|uniref:Peptidase S1 and S6 chymotrypsin/Hap n=1 Tax=Evansella cellulosilytica (strain ATCC 21833 / DSM 2522 / FERM P-1141 / JCM 9156 / N-4) TaxID=649639 RepID=E6U011_EVAC2|nr:trypsin-like peptidase domain-containing protein [Evansella cellulosilytica]ADU29015.1 peptidase S1 and S6 chymotrypsin/Hap [Evansella cellulosilytica DSM 2522]